MIRIDFEGLDLTRLNHRIFVGINVTSTDANALLSGPDDGTSQASHLNILGPTWVFTDNASLAAILAQLPFLQSVLIDRSTIDLARTITMSSMRCLILWNCHLTSSALHYLLTGMPTLSLCCIGGLSISMRYLHCTDTRPLSLPVTLSMLHLNLTCLLCCDSVSDEDLEGPLAAKLHSYFSDWILWCTTPILLSTLQLSLSVQDVRLARHIIGLASTTLQHLTLKYLDNESGDAYLDLSAMFHLETFTAEVPYRHLESCVRSLISLSSSKATVMELSIPVTDMLHSYEALCALDEHFYYHGMILFQS
ncbi:uncharacterized protein EV420DRAFT_1651275 [Desarmillaria tabescens]|uniref:Uncharacterized protein n=1 Tax=Armillaria tabescens TaxID=1929756 RepID=A0AA39MM12_ARMTA|nr:uncharacterized protein EV420DRAFT_1651275 [Desarmillaria tabescens]KAK0438858.1 hypothetical protein EV420DRAFT_1651275 [Desarmillaria tabescens]